MMLEPDRYPSAEGNDPEPVVLALETGRAHWGEGDPREAVRWLRRAAEHAEQAGNDARALQLARVAADMAATLQLAPSMAPPPVLPSPAPQATWDDFSDKTIVDAPTGLPRPATKLGAAKGAATPLPPSVAAPPRPGASVSRPSRPSATTVESAIVKPAARPRAALRVAVSRAPGGSGALHVRILEEGAELPAGASEALLVPLDPDTDLLSTK